MSAHCKHGKSIHYLTKHKSKEKLEHTSAINVKKGKFCHELFGQFYFGMAHKTCLY